MTEGARPAFGRVGAALWRRVGPEVLLAGLDGSEIDRLSVPASALWLLLERPLGREELVAALADEFDIEAGDIAGHVDRLLDELVTRGWLEPAERADG